jgi:hypothetical protein
MNYLKSTFLLLPLFFSACAALPKVPLDYTQGAVVSSISSEVSLSARSSGNSLSGHGFMVYQRPDKVHLVVLSPFGTTLMEVFTLGDRITLVYPSQGVAYAGRFDELPEGKGMQGWRLMRWVMDADPAGPASQNGTVERTSRQGGQEKVTFAAGLITAKSTSNGDRVFYRDYQSVKGVPFARELEILNGKDDRIRLKLEEPEVNTTLDEAAFTPRLDGMKLLPLSALKGL